MYEKLRMTSIVAVFVAVCWFQFTPNKVEAQELAAIGGGDCCETVLNVDCGNAYPASGCTRKVNRCKFSTDSEKRCANTLYSSCKNQSSGQPDPKCNQHSQQTCDESNP